MATTPGKERLAEAGVWFGAEANVRNLMAVGLSGVLALAVGCGSQKSASSTTVFTKHVVAHPLAPNLMLLVDWSASMLTNTGTQAPCPSTIGACGPGVPCPAGCATRMSDLQAALHDWLASQGTRVRFGLAVFPSDDACTATTGSKVLVELPPRSITDVKASLQAQADQVSTAISTVVPGGDTPTADSLRFAGALPQLVDPDRDNVIVLFTDGAPACGATSLADDAVAAVAELRARNIKTMVIGFGPDALSQPGADALSRVAAAGGLARSCLSATDAECGPGDACNTATLLCGLSFEPAADAGELSAVLTRLTASAPRNVCTYDLPQKPLDHDLVTASVNGNSLQACASATGCDTFTLDVSGSPAKIVFLGATCQTIEDATPFAPVDLEVRFTHG